MLAHSAEVQPSRQVVELVEQFIFKEQHLEVYQLQLLLLQRRSLLPELIILGQDQHLVVGVRKEVWW